MKPRTHTYIHSDDVKENIRNRFEHIINGKGLVIPRIAIANAVADIIMWVDDLTEGAGGE